MIQPLSPKVIEMLNDLGRAWSISKKAFWVALGFANIVGAVFVILFLYYFLIGLGTVSIPPATVLCESPYSIEAIKYDMNKSKKKAKEIVKASHGIISHAGKKSKCIVTKKKIIAEIVIECSLLRPCRVKLPNGQKYYVPAKTLKKL